VRQQALWHGRWESAREILPPVKAAGGGPAAVYEDQVLRLPPDPPDPVQCALPQDTLAFTGRDQELSRITAAVAETAVAGGVVAIHAIDGMPGVGKTALAIHAAHYLADRFPDGQLFLDLHAHTPGQVPMDPGAALAALLAADGVDLRYLPATLDERAARWRDRLASKKVLLVLDNAADSDQVRPLLPGRQTCTVLITSRRHLGDLPGRAEVIALNVMEPSQATAMFLRLAPRAGTDATAAIEDLVAVAGYLPLAVALLARLYTKHPVWTLNDLLAECRTRLLSVTAEHATIAAAYDLSYHYLPDARQWFFRCLGAHPGTELGPYAAAALAGVPLAESITHLNALFGDSLLAEIGYRRYAMHDLIRQYARDLAAADPPARQEQVVERLLNYYQRTARVAATYLTLQTLPSQAGTAPAVAAETGLPEVNGHTQALAWMRTERANLLACLARTRDPRHLLALTSSLAELLRLDGPWNEAVVLHSAAAQAALQAGDQLGQANALNHLGEAQRLIDDYPGAEQTLHAALSLYQALGNKLGQANVLGNLGLLRQHIGDYSGGIDAMQQALAMHRQLEDRLGEAYSLLNIGGVECSRFYGHRIRLPTD
jgi:tetratricopeptide (TPR) repeat protein